MRLLWIALVWPEPDASAAGLRTLQLLSIAQQLGFEVHISSACQSNKHRESLENLGFKTHSFAPNDSSFDSFVRGLHPEVVVFDRFMIEEQFSWRVRGQCPDAIRILDTIDLHFLRKDRERSLSREPTVRSESGVEHAFSDTLLRELSSIYRSDLSLIISRTELELLLTRYQVPQALLSLCPLAAVPELPFRPWSERAGLVSIGNFNHPPNLDAVRLLKEGLWDKIRRACAQRGAQPLELHVFGAYPSPEVLSWNAPEYGFHVNGWTPDAVGTLSRFRLNLAPLRFGAGLKGKILDGWRTGTPCVATAVAAEGMGLGELAEAPFGGVTTDDLNQFPDLVANLYYQETLWNQAQVVGHQILSAHFSLDQTQESFQKAVTTAMSTREERRLSNVIGAMLWYHGARSTEFFSRWIEAKNRGQAA